MLTRSSTRRYIESVAFVAAWIACGFLFRLKGDAYLLLGVPLLAVFQLGIRRRPLRELWVRDPAQSFRLDGLALALALPLMAVPAYGLFTTALPQQLWIEVLWRLCGVAGGGIAGVVLRNQRADALRRALPSFGATLVFGLALEAVPLLLAGRAPGVDFAHMPFLIEQFFLLFAVFFTLEEVAFRGGLDAHVHPPGESSSRARAWGSATLVSVMWGLWHLPIVVQLGGPVSADLFVGLILVHTLLGVPLSFCWRQSGTLVLPCAAHALIDAYRNVLLL